MSAAIAVTPTEPRAAIDACRVDVSGADPNDVSGFDPEVYPTAPENRFYLAFVLDGEDLGKSYVFSVSGDGDHQFNTYIFPEAGSWTVELRLKSNDSVVATESVTVS